MVKEDLYVFVRTRHTVETLWKKIRQGQDNGDLKRRKGGLRDGIPPPLSRFAFWSRLLHDRAVTIAPYSFSVEGGASTAA